MANIPIWPGSSSFKPGDTPFGFYDNDPIFAEDADKVCTFCTRRMGYPIVEIELQAINFYAAFEEAVTIYGNELYAYKIRENYLTLEGAPTSIDIEESIVTPNFGRIIDYSQQYGSEAGTGGNVPLHKMGIPLSGSVQDYDLDYFATLNGFKEPNDIEIMRVFYESPPASALWASSYEGFGFGLGGATAAGITGVGGLGGFGNGGGYLMMPLNYDMAVIQQIEMNDMVRVSNHSFEMHDNVLRVFPIPISNQQSGSAGYDINNPSGSAGTMWVEFMSKSQRSSASIVEAYDKIKFVSGVPYKNPTYNEINSVGRSWIFEMTLAISKEMLGYVRGKYETIPIPNAEITLNQADLLSASREEKEALLASLRAFFDETSREKLLERRTMESDYVMKELDRVPRVIYIG
jgi:hypothetical protein|tara:strand:- start:4956 stop:6170 length:1215 start_codon:yes stop_codon:yes gene_type:complete